MALPPEQNVEAKKPAVDLNSVSMNSLLLYRRDLLSQYNSTTKLDQLFQNPEKVAEILDIFVNSTDTEILMKIPQLILSNKLIILKQIFADVNNFNLLAGLLKEGSNPFKLNKVTEIFKKASASIPNIFFPFINNQALDLLINLFYDLHITPIYEMFAEILKTNPETKIYHFNFIYGWLYGICKKSPLIDLPQFGENSISPELLQKYQAGIDYQKLLLNKESFYNFLKLILLFTKNVSVIEGFDQYHSLFNWIAYYLLSPYQNYFDSKEIQRGTKFDSGLALIIDTYSNLPLNVHVMNQSLNIINDFFFGSELSVSAVNYLIKFITIETITNPSDKELYLTKIPFELLMSLNFIKESFVNKNNDIHKANLILQAVPNVFTNLVAIEYVNNLFKLSKQNELLNKEVKERIIDIILFIWTNDDNSESIMKLFLLQLALGIGDCEQNENYHHIYTKIAVPFSKLNDLPDEEIIQFKTDRNYKFDYISLLGIDYNEYLEKFLNFFNAEPFTPEDFPDDSPEEEEANL